MKRKQLLNISGSMLLIFLFNSCPIVAANESSSDTKMPSTMDGCISISLVGRNSDGSLITRYKNCTPKKIRAFKGILTVKDIFDEPLKSFDFRIESALPAGMARTTILQAQATGDKKVALLKTSKFESLSLSWKPKVILFADGTSARKVLQPVSNTPLQPVQKEKPRLAISSFTSDSNPLSSSHDLITYKHIRLGITPEEFCRLDLNGLVPTKYPQPTFAEIRPSNEYPGVLEGRLCRNGEYGPESCKLSVGTILSPAKFYFVQDGPIFKLVKIEFLFESESSEDDLLELALLKKYGTARVFRYNLSKISTWEKGNGKIVLSKNFPDVLHGYLRYEYLPLIKKLDHLEGRDKDISKDL